MSAIRPRRAPFRVAILVVSRLIALALIALAVLDWMRLLTLPGTVGLQEVATPERLAAALAALVLPVAAVGLWLLAAWGAVLWTGAAAAAMLAQGLGEPWAAELWPVAVFHGLALPVYIGLRLAGALADRRRR